MACARCDFYTPKASSKGQLLEAKDNLQRMLAHVPLTDDEQAAVDDGRAALDQLLKRLIDIPTPTGTTPREIGVPATATLLPIVYRQPPKMTTNLTNLIPHNVVGVGVLCLRDRAGGHRHQKEPCAAWAVHST
jgi:hypothetical protein